MVQPVELIPLVCLKCDTPLPAQPDEVAWVCTRCGQGLLLDETAERGLSLLEVQYAAGIDPAGKGKPFWVVEGRVDLQRSTYESVSNKAGEAQQLWSQPRRFFIPASDLPLQTLAGARPAPAAQPARPAARPAGLLRAGDRLLRMTCRRWQSSLSWRSKPGGATCSNR